MNPSSPIAVARTRSIRAAFFRPTQLAARAIGTRLTTGPAATAETATPWRTTARPARSEARTHWCAKRFVHVVRQDVKFSFGIEEDAVVAGSNPIPVAVDERVVDRQKP